MTVEHKLQAELRSKTSEVLSICHIIYDAITGHNITRPKSKESCLLHSNTRTILFINSMKFELLGAY